VGSRALFAPLAGQAQDCCKSFVVNEGHRSSQQIVRVNSRDSFILLNSKIQLFLANILYLWLGKIYILNSSMYRKKYRPLGRTSRLQLPLAFEE
jgi:hypothetical protein